MSTLEVAAKAGAAKAVAIATARIFFMNFSLG